MSELSFEEAFKRLEVILEEMNASSLEQAIQLYEEADRLIVFCQKKLKNAEQKIEFLNKKRAHQEEAVDS